MISVSINNVYSYLSGEIPDPVMTELRETLGYKMMGAHFSEKVQKGKWDGFIRLFWKRGNTFPTGLFPIVREILKNNDIDYEIKDLRTVPTTEREIPLHGITLRDYQQEAVNNAIQKTRGIIKMATGSGKSLVIARIVGLLNLPTMIYIHKKDIMYQLQKRLQEWLQVPIGLIGAGHQDIERVNICMIQTVKNVLEIKEKKTVYEDSDETTVDKLRVKEAIQNAECIIADECHHLSCKTFRGIGVASKKSYYRFGTSASPWREDNADILIEAFTARPVIDVSASYLIKEGYLSKPTIYFYHLDYPELRESLSYAPYHELYKEIIVNNEKRHFEVAKLALKGINTGKTVLVAVQRIDHGKNLLRILHKYCEFADKSKIIFVRGDTKDDIRKDALEKLDNGELKCIIATSIYGEGVDIPGLGLLIACKSQKSSVDAFQLLGRALRRTDNKNTVTIVDIWDEGKYLRKHALARERIYKTEEEYDIIHTSNIDEIEIK